jgi:hypothetical protein
MAELALQVTELDERLITSAGSAFPQEATKLDAGLER